MKKIIGFIILVTFFLIPRYSYYGVVNDKEEKITNTQEIIQQGKIEKSKMLTEQKEKSVTEKENIQNQTIVNQNKSVKNVQKIKKEIKEVLEIENEEQEIKNDENQKQEIIIETEFAEEETQKKVEENTEQKQNIEIKCASDNHGMTVGNTGKWFNTKIDAITEYETEIKKWGEKWTNFEIDNETYYSNCPSGYEIWTCPYCNKWTLNYYK